MPRRTRVAAGEEDAAPGTNGRGLVPGAKLEPTHHVERELKAPDGTTVRARVPVYPPFRLETRVEREQRAGGGRCLVKSSRKNGRNGRGADS